MPIQLAGSTLVRIVDDPSQPVSTIELVYGRLILFAGLPGSRVKLVLGGYEGEIVFGDDPATVAVELRRQLALGDDPETTAAKVLVDMYAAKGSFQWRADGQAADVQPLSWRLPDAPADGGAEIPAWIGAEQIDNLMHGPTANWNAISNIQRTRPPIAR